MQILDSIKSDPGALVVGALWMIYVLGQHVLGTMRNNKQQRDVDNGNNQLVKNLQTTIETASRLSAEERERGDRLGKLVTDMSIEVGQLRADLKHSEIVRGNYKEENAKLIISVESLVIENRNKDRSITHLVDLNKQLLRTIGSSAEATESITDVSFRDTSTTGE